MNEIGLIHGKTGTNTQSFQHFVKISYKSEVSFPGFLDCELVNHFININAFRQLTFNIIDNIARSENLNCPMIYRIYIVFYKFQFLKRFSQMKPQIHWSSEIILGLGKGLGEYEVPYSAVNVKIFGFFKLNPFSFQKPSQPCHFY